MQQTQSRSAPRSLIFFAAEDRAFLSHRLPMARAARDAGYAVHVATNDGAGRAAIEAEGFILDPIPVQRGLLSPFSTLKTVRALRSIYKRLNPVIVHHSGLQCCVLGSVAAFGLNVAQVNAMTGMGYVFTATSTKARILKAIVQIAARLFINRKRSVVLVQNPDDWNASIQLGIDAARLVLIPGSGVDTEALTPMPEPDGPITIGFAGRLLTDKGIRALIGAHRLLRAQGRDVRLLIAGTIDPANPASVTQAEVDGWASEPGIHVLGHVTNIADLWRQSHIAALPSHREGLPKTLLEAAACGRPMVATDVPGCREIAIANRTGLLVPVEAPDALADAILRLADGPALRATYGQAARALVEREMSAKAVGTSIVQLYARIQNG